MQHDQQGVVDLTLSEESDEDERTLYSEPPPQKKQCCKSEKPAQVTVQSSRDETQMRGHADTADPPSPVQVTADHHMAGSQQADLRECNKILPPYVAFDTASQAGAALTLAMTTAFGLCHTLNNNRSNGRRKVYECLKCSDVDTSFFNEPTQGPDEADGNYKRRRCGLLDSFRKANSCAFTAILRRYGTAVDKVSWKFDTFGNSVIRPHSSDCTAIARLKGRALQSALRASVRNDPLMSKDLMAKTLTATDTSFSAAMMPSKSSLYRAKTAIKHADDDVYTIMWARLETYLEELQATNATSVMTVLEKQHNRFQRCFVGFKLCVDILKCCGLDQYSTDACFTKHHIVNGMQIHLLMARTGLNTYLCVAFSLELSETSATYAWFARQCRALGFYALVAVPDDRFSRHPVIFSDGFKGTDAFSVPGLHHARCAFHLANSIRALLKTWRKKRIGDDINIGFHNQQVIEVCKAATIHERNHCMQKLAATSEAAAGRLRAYNELQYSVAAMAAKGIPCFGHCTSNSSESTNGVMTKWRALHPYKFVDEMVRYTSERVGLLRDRYNKLSTQGKILTPYAKKMMIKAFDNQRKRNYRLQQQAGANTWVVWDPHSTNQVFIVVRVAFRATSCDLTITFVLWQERHIVCINSEKMSCTPCRTWGVYRAICGHLMLVLARVKPFLLNQPAALARATFHPAYLVQNGVAGCSGKHLVAPVIDEGPAPPPLPSALGIDGEVVEEPTSEPMLPPTRYTLENYKSNVRRGRPRTRRYRSRGAESSDRGAPAPRRHDGGGNDDATFARSSLSQFSLDDF